MKNIAFSLISLSLIFLLSASSTRAQYTIDTATPINPGESGGGTFDSEHPNYVWKVDLPHDGSLSAVISQGDKSGQPYVIYDEAISGDSWIESGGENLGAGTYYIVVKPFMFPTWQMDSYSIECRATPNLLPNDTEPNNDRETAQETGAGVKNEGHLGYYHVGAYDDVDWWTLHIPGDGMFQISSKPGTGLSLLSPAIYTPDSPMINPLEYETKSDGSFVQTYALAEGTYKINATKSRGYGSYTLDTVHQLATLANDREPNDAMDSADILGLDDESSGHLGHCSGSYSSINGPVNTIDGNDWWGVSLDEDGELTIDIRAEEKLEIYGYLYNETGDMLKLNFNGDTDTKITMPLGKGYYYVIAERQRGYGSYTIKSESIPASLESDPEPNAVREDASPFFNSATGRLGYYIESLPSANGPYHIFDTEDFWKISIAEDGPIGYSAVAEEGLDIALHLYNANGGWLKGAYSDGGRTALTHTLSAGDYYILAEATSGFGSYTLIDNMAPTAVENTGSDVVPKTFTLHPPTPNPFNPQTTIRYELPTVSHVSLIIYDINGRQVAILKDGMSNAGLHEVLWNGRDDSGAPVGGGVYLYELKAGNFSDRGKMTLLK